MLQRNERVKLAASFWNNIGAGMVIGGMAAAFFLDKPQGTWTKIGIAIAGLLLGWLCYSQQHFDLYAHSARRAPLGQRVLPMAGQPREAANRSFRAVRQELPA